MNAETPATTPPADERLDLGKLADAVGYVLRRAQLAVFADFNRRFAALDLKPTQFTVLHVIGANPDRKQSEVAAALGIQATNFVAMLTELEKRGLCQRTRLDADRRSYAVTLTPQGEALVAKGDRLLAEQEKAIEHILGSDGRRKLVELAAQLSQTTQW